MISSPTSTVRQRASQDAPLAASAGESATPEQCGTSFNDWIDLMEAVEALCPDWPEQEITIGDDFRI